MSPGQGPVPFLCVVKVDLTHQAGHKQEGVCSQAFNAGTMNSAYKCQSASKCSYSVVPAPPSCEVLDGWVCMPLHFLDSESIGNTVEEGLCEAEEFHDTIFEVEMQ